jgi:hypothetical protein
MSNPDTSPDTNPDEEDCSPVLSEAFADTKADTSLENGGPHVADRERTGESRLRRIRAIPGPSG